MKKAAASKSQPIMITVGKVKEHDPSGGHYLEKFMGPARPAPDVEDIARRGGMPASCTPYVLGKELNGRFPISASGYSTSTVNYFVYSGLEKTADDIRVIRRHFGIEDPSTIRSRVKNATWMPDEMIERVIAGESEFLYPELEKLVPGVEQCRPKPRAPDLAGPRTHCAIFGKRGWRRHSNLEPTL
jgi:hypothetical protein